MKLEPYIFLDNSDGDGRDLSTKQPNLPNSFRSFCEQLVVLIFLIFLSRSRRLGLDLCGC